MDEMNEQKVGEVIENADIEAAEVTPEVEEVSAQQEEQAVVEEKETPTAELAGEEPIVENEPEKTDEAPTEEVEAGDKTEGDAGGPTTGMDTVEEPAKEEEFDIEKLRAEIEEEKAIIAEEKACIEFERQAKVDEIQLANAEQAISEALAKSFENIGVDTNKTIEEIRKEDPEKAFRVQQLILEAQATRESIVQSQRAAAKARLQDIVFTKASRLLEKFGLSKDETPIVAETFVNIINEVGIKNLDDDLVAKVELAVGRAKLLAPKVVKAVEQVKEIAEDVKETVNELMTPAPEEEPVVVHEEEVEEPKIELDEFKEGVTTGVSKAEKTTDGILAELASITDPRKRVEFYKENFALIEKAMRESKPSVDRGNIQYGK